MIWLINNAEIIVSFEIPINQAVVVFFYTRSWKTSRKKYKPWTTGHSGFLGNLRTSTILYSCVPCSCIEQFTRSASAVYGFMLTWLWEWTAGLSNLPVRSCYKISSPVRGQSQAGSQSSYRLNFSLFSNLAILQEGIGSEFNAIWRRVSGIWFIREAQYLTGDTPEEGTR